MKNLLNTIKNSIHALTATSQQTTLLAVTIGRALADFGKSFLSKQLLSKLRLTKRQGRMSIRSMEYALMQQGLDTEEKPPLETTQFKMLIAEQAVRQATLVANTNTSWENRIHQESVAQKFNGR